MAVISLMYFCELNEKNLEIDDETLYELALFVAKSDSQKKDFTLQAIKLFLKEYLR